MALVQHANETSPNPARRRYVQRQQHKERGGCWIRQKTGAVENITEIAPRAGVSSSAFGDLLRQYRKAAGLTQQQLAEDAKLSVRGLCDLERGAIQRPRRYTIQALADALDLSSDEQLTFRAAASRAPMTADASQNRSAFSSPQHRVLTVFIVDIGSYALVMLEHGSAAETSLVESAAQLQRASAPSSNWAG